MMQPTVGMGTSAQHTPDTCLQTSPFHLEHTSTGIWLKQAQQPLAWIICGYHYGKIHQQVSCCEFVDVAYYRQTRSGVNLETADFNSLDQALTFLVNIFAIGGAV